MGDRTVENMLAHVAHLKYVWLNYTAVPDWTSMRNIHVNYHYAYTGTYQNWHSYGNLIGQPEGI